MADIWKKIVGGTRDAAVQTKLTTQKAAKLTEIGVIKEKIKGKKQVGGVQVLPLNCSCSLTLFKMYCNFCVIFVFVWTMSLFLCSVFQTLLETCVVFFFNINNIFFSIWVLIASHLLLSVLGFFSILAQKIYLLTYLLTIHFPFVQPTTGVWVEGIRLAW